jgi:hypothetical protein
MDTLHEGRYAVLSISRSFLLIIRNVSDKFLNKIKSQILCSITFSRKSCRLWDNVEKYGTAGQATDGSIIGRMRFTCWIPNVTETPSEYVILIAFPLHQWFRECTSALRHTYIACLISFLVRLLLPTHCRCSWLLLHLITLSDTHSAGLPWTRDRSVAETST